MPWRQDSLRASAPKEWAGAHTSVARSSRLSSQPRSSAYDQLRTAPSHHPRLRCQMRTNHWRGSPNRRPRDEVAEAKELLGVTTNERVGELTFEYFMDAEGES